MFQRFLANMDSSSTGVAPAVCPADSPTRLVLNTRIRSTLHEAIQVTRMSQHRNLSLIVSETEGGAGELKPDISLNVNKFVMAAVSPFLHSLLLTAGTEDATPAVIFDKTSLVDLVNLLQLINTGCVVVQQAAVTRLFDIAEALQLNFHVDVLPLVKTESTRQQGEEERSNSEDGRDCSKDDMLFEEGEIVVPASENEEKAKRKLNISSTSEEDSSITGDVEDGAVEFKRRKLLSMSGPCDLASQLEMSEEESSEDCDNVETVEDSRHRKPPTVPEGDDIKSSELGGTAQATPGSFIVVDGLWYCTSCAVSFPNRSMCENHLCNINS